MQCESLVDVLFVHVEGLDVILDALSFFPLLTFCAFKLLSLDALLSFVCLNSYALMLCYFSLFLPFVHLTSFFLFFV